MPTALSRGSWAPTLALPGSLMPWGAPLHPRLCPALEAVPSTPALPMEGFLYLPPPVLKASIPGTPTPSMLSPPKAGPHPGVSPHPHHTGDSSSTTRCRGAGRGGTSPFTNPCP